MTNPAPALSVVLPTWNRAHSLGRALASVLAQTGDGDEILVVDDGSQDATEAVVRQLDAGIRYLRIAHGGAAAARNAGVRSASHEWVAFLDSDDVWLPGKVAVQRAAVRAFPEAVLCVAEYDGRTGSGERHPTRMAANGWDPSRLGPRRTFPCGEERCAAWLGDAFDLLFDTGPIIQINTVLARRSHLLACPFPTDLEIYEEDEVFARLAARGPLLFVDRVVSELQAHDGPRISDLLGGLRSEASWLTVAERVWGRDPGFQARRGPAYRERIRELRVRHARSLLARAETRAARRELRRVASPPPLLRLLSEVPSRVLRPVLRVRKAVRKAWRSGVAR